MKIEAFDILALVDRVTILEQQLGETRDELRDAKTRSTRAIRRSRVSAGLAFVALLGTMLTLSHPAAMAQAGITLSSLLTRVVALETKTAALSQTGTPGTSSAKLTITGDNVQIVDGSGYTDDGTQGEISGAKLKRLGNLIIGYNALGNGLGNGDVRTGSHNLILGDANNYSSYGGSVGGQNNSISGQYASVAGGVYNIASGESSTVGGGYGNLASSYSASISGGLNNTASGPYSSVSGGGRNTASNYSSSVSGGEDNTASAEFSAVSGGGYNLASGQVSSVSGGDYVTQSNSFGWSGGSYQSP